MNYNLLDEEWIPVLYRNGEWKRVGIRKALEDAGWIRQIAASNPMDRVAIVRFLLALLYWCKGNPPNDEDVTSRRSFPSDWFCKLDDNRDCFNLLGEGKRFYQYRRPGDKALTANYLIHEIPTGSNKWHFRHSTDEVDGLCPSCCAVGLLRLPLFSTSGGRGKPPGINSKPPIYVIPVGVSLAKTLRLSWRKVSNLGFPAWEKPDMQLPNAGEVPLLTGLTWLPRRVWLGNPEESEARCVSCGRREHPIRSSVFAAIGSTRTVEGELGRIWRDPHVIYEESSKGEVTSLHASNALGAADAAAGQWAKIMAGILRKQEGCDASPQCNASCEPEGEQASAWVVGFSSVQNDKYLEAMECLMPLPVSLHQVAESLAQIERWQMESGRIEKRLGRSNALNSAATAAIRPHVEVKVSAKAAELLVGDQDAWDEAAAQYRPMMALVAGSLSPGFTAAALQRRQQIAGTTPNMRPQTESARKARRRKGGNE